MNDTEGGGLVQTTEWEESGRRCASSSKLIDVNDVRIN